MQNIDQKVINFISLLVKTSEPTLAEYEKYAGECGGESELAFMLNECLSKGRNVKMKQCVDFTRKRCKEAKNVPSLKLKWIRKFFSTAGKEYKIIDIQSESETVYLIEVEIGKNKFQLYYNTSTYPPGGVIVDVYKINGKKLTYYLKNNGSR